MSKKEKFALYLTPEKKARLERRYQEDGSRSITGFIERAIDFYLDYLSANNARASSLPVPMYVPYLIIPLGMLVSAIRYLCQVWQEAGAFRAEPVPEEGGGEK